MRTSQTINEIRILAKTASGRRNSRSSFAAVFQFVYSFLFRPSATAHARYCQMEPIGHLTIAVPDVAVVAIEA